MEIFGNVMIFLFISGASAKTRRKKRQVKEPCQSDLQKTRQAQGGMYGFALLFLCSLLNLRMNFLKVKVLVVRID